MKTVQITSNGQEVQFSTRSVIVDGQEYLYSHITELRHSEEKRVYGFKCDGQVRILPYEEKDAKVLRAIFSQVAQMHSKPAPSGVPPVPTPASAQTVSAGGPAAGTVPQNVPAQEVPAPAPVEATASQSVPTEVAAPSPSGEGIPGSAEAAFPGIAPEFTGPGNQTETNTPDAPQPVQPLQAGIPSPQAEPAQIAAADAVASETGAVSDIVTGTALPDKKACKAAEREAKLRQKEEIKAAKEAARRERAEAKQAAASGSVTSYAEETGQDLLPEQKSARFKKAIIIFLIVLAVFALAGLAWWFFIGPSSDPQMGPNTPDSTQFNNVDDLINDLED